MTQKQAISSAQIKYLTTNMIELFDDTNIDQDLCRNMVPLEDQ